jgi:hypothetical protein
MSEKHPINAHTAADFEKIARKELSTTPAEKVANIEDYNTNLGFYAHYI